VAVRAHAASDDTQPSITEAGKGRRLVADQRYFGLEARTLRAGLERVLGRTKGAPDVHIGVELLSEAFRIEAADAETLLRALTMGGLLRVHANGRCTSTAHLREYAEAVVVAPLSRARAKMIVDHTRELAAQINAKWTRNPFRIKVVAVSGSYMSRRGHLPDLRLSVVLRKRPDARKRRWTTKPDRSEAMREILEALRAQSSFVVARVVADRQSIPRPFALVYSAEDETTSDVHTWERFRSIGASISRRLGGK
jgi:hypothetical protein